MTAVEQATYCSECGHVADDVTPGPPADLFGIRVVECPWLPLEPTPGQDARRAVRHGMADVLEWLGEPVGPKPGEKTHALLIGRDLMASVAIVGELRDA